MGLQARNEHKICVIWLKLPLDLVHEVSHAFGPAAIA